MFWYVCLILLVIAVAVAVAIAVIRRRQTKLAAPAEAAELVVPAEPPALDVPAELIPPAKSITPAGPILPVGPITPAGPAGPAQYPICLVHGFLGWGELRLFGRRYSYFRGVAETLTETGTAVHIITLPPVASVEARARALANAVHALAAPRIHLVAHSMGGIDARYAIAKLGLKDRVASLVTIGTPHRGTPLARLGNWLPVVGLRRAVALAGVDAGAIDALTPERMARFNEEVPDDPDVYYASVVGSARWLRSHPALWTGHVLMGRAAGMSDGVVPMESQRWGEVLAQLDADHWAQIGWSQAFDACSLYREIALRLRAREPALLLGNHLRLYASAGTSPS